METNNQQIENYMEYKANQGVKESTITAYAYILEQLDVTVNKPFLEMTEADILKYLKPYKQQTRNTRIGCFKDFYAYLVHAKSPDDLPECIQRLKQSRIRLDDIEYRKRVISEELYHKLLDYCHGPQQKALLQCLWETGARKSGIIALNTGDVWYDGVYTHFIISVSKTTPREVISEGRAEHVLRWQELHPYKDTQSPLFYSEHNGKVKRVSKDYAYHTLERIRKRAAIKRKVRPHDFRHSKTTHMLGSGVPETHVKTILGFTKNTRMLERYDHNNVQDYADWLSQKEQDAPPTYDVMKKQKERLEAKHEKQIAKLQDQMTQLLTLLEKKETLQTAIAHTR